MVSCINISVSIQIYGPGPINCDAGWKFVTHFELTGIPIPEVNVSRAEKLPLFPGYYFLMISRFSSGARSNLSAPEPLSPVDRERRALLDHAALCRRVAGEISHTQAAKRLRMMAQEYETRAIRLEGVAREANDNVGASARTAQTCTDVLRTSDWRLQ
jgi:hypothetical protein